VAEVFAANQRRALLVMATGTGKTRTTMALIDVFLRASQAQTRHVDASNRRDSILTRDRMNRWLSPFESSAECSGRAKRMCDTGIFPMTIDA
jgi:hypothetical protein